MGRKPKRKNRQSLWNKDESYHKNVHFISFVTIGFFGFIESIYVYILSIYSLFCGYIIKLYTYVNVLDNGKSFNDYNFIYVYVML